MSTPALTFRVATRDDEPFLWDMLHRALFVPPGAPPFPRSALREPTIARYLEAWSTREGDYGVVACVDGGRVGAAWVRRFSAAAPGYGFVDEMVPELTIAVCEAHRGRGIGTQLLTCLQNTFASLSLSCDPRNPASRLYGRMGFVSDASDRTLVWRRTVTAGG